MGIPVLIEGVSGSGKSSGMRNLPPDSFGLVNVARKPLPFKSSKKGVETDDYGKISALLTRATSNIIVIDDAQFLMANAYMRSATMKLDKSGVFDFYKTIGYDFWNLVQQVISLPPEKIIYFLGHTEIDQFGNTKFKTIGKMLDEKITVEGMFTIVLRTHVDSSRPINDGRYSFITQSDGTDTVKTPIGMFADRLIDNDLAAVDKAIREYYEIEEGRRTA